METHVVFEQAQAIQQGDEDPLTFIRCTRPHASDRCRSCLSMELYISGLEDSGEQKIRELMAWHVYLLTAPFDNCSH